MAFQRRRSRGFARRRFGRPFAKRKQGWVTSLFNESAVPLAATTLTELVLLGSAEANPMSGLSGVRTAVTIARRTIVNFIFNFLPSQVAATDIWAIYWAIYTIDTEDADADIGTTAGGGIWQTERVIQSGILGATFVGATNQQALYHGVPVSVDYRSIVKMRDDQLLVFGFQPTSASGTAVSLANVSGVSRVLVDVN